MSTEPFKLDLMMLHHVIAMGSPEQWGERAASELARQLRDHGAPNAPFEQQAQALLAAFTALQQAGQEIPEQDTLAAILASNDRVLWGPSLSLVVNVQYRKAAGMVLDLFRPIFARRTQEQDDVRAVGLKFAEMAEKYRAKCDALDAENAALRQRAERAERERGEAHAHIERPEKAHEAVLEECAALRARIAELEASREPGAASAPRGIYIASKAKHGGRWRELRASGVPIVASWIDEAEEGATSDWADLWSRCIGEASGAVAVVVYVEPYEIHKGSLVELGAALHAGVPVFWVGPEYSTAPRHRLVQRVETIERAIAMAVEQHERAQRQTRAEPGADVVERLADTAWSALDQAKSNEPIACEQHTEARGLYALDIDTMAAMIRAVLAHLAAMGAEAWQGLTVADVQSVVHGAEGRLAERDEVRAVLGVARSRLSPVLGALRAEIADLTLEHAKAVDLATDRLLAAAAAHERAQTAEKRVAELETKLAGIRPDVREAYDQVQAHARREVAAHNEATAAKADIALLQEKIAKLETELAVAKAGPTREQLDNEADMRAWQVGG